MKYKFKPQTGLVVAGLVAATYASACYYAQTATCTLCFYASATVDQFNWSRNAGWKDVIATSDWNQGVQNGVDGYLTSYFNQPPGAGYDTLTFDTIRPTYCYGPAKFLNPKGQYDTVAYWENDLFDLQSRIQATPANGGSWGVLSGNSCP